MSSRSAGSVIVEPTPGTPAPAPGPVTTRRRRRVPVFSAVTAALALVTLALIVYPLTKMVARVVSASDSGTWIALFQQSWFGEMVGDTLIVVGISSVLAVALAALMAWINERTNAGIGSLGDALPLVPLFLPGVAMAVGWVMLASPEVGFVNGLLGAVMPWWDVNLNIYSHAGMIFVFVLDLMPYAYLPIVAAFRSMDPSIEEAARVNGAKAWRIFRSVAVPATWPSIVAGLLLTLVVGFAQVSIPIIIGTRPGIDLISVRIIRSIRSTYPPQYDTALGLSVILFAALAALWFMQRRVLKRGHFAMIGGRSGVATRTQLGRGWRILARGTIVTYVLLAAVLPIVALGIVSFQGYWQPNLLDSTWTTKHFEAVLDYDVARTAVFNSLSIGLVGGAVTVLIAALMMVYAHRRMNRLGQWADGIAKLPAIVPHTVVAVAFIFAFAGPPFSLGGTVLILVLAYFVVYLPYASIASQASVAQVDRSLEEAAYMSGAREARTTRSILVPLIMPGLLAAWALVFVRMLGDLSVSVLLSTGATPVLGFVMLDVWDQGSFNRMAALSLLMTGIMAPIVVIMLRLGRPRWRRARRRPRSTAIREGAINR